ncbi:MAG: HEAT repeat domain-containing protein, partial [Candidatus Pacebacteria bacterium]|nr:HEAT repeat domain-containing protein [Candidatus Paceibacterota bacterium]
MSPLNIVTTIAMFPLLLPLWEQRPITSDDIYPTPYPIEVQNADVRSAAEGFRYGDYAFRQRLVQNLAETHNRLAAETLLTQLQIEPNEDIKATILGQIRLLPYNANAALQAVTPLLDSPDRTVRQWAVTLYGELDDASGDVLLQKTLNDPDPQVRRRAAEALPVHAQSLTASELQKLRKSPDAVLRAWGWAAMCHVKDARQIVSQLLAACRAEPPNVRHAIANHMSTLSPSVTQDLYDALSQDNHPSVRGQTAAAIGRAPAPAFLPLVLRLADDPDYEVRRQAVHSLVAYPEPAAGEKIVAKYGDPSVFVRREAESSATELHPQFDMADLSVARISDSDPNVRYRAYNVLGSIDARQHGEAVGNALLQERDPRLISASLLALSRLRNIQFTEQALRLARHADANVRKNAVLVLGNATGPR